MAAARAVVGWCGDPTISWSVLLQATLTAHVSAGAVTERLVDLVTRYPHLGVPPTVLAADGSHWPAVCASFADEPYSDGAPLLRVAVGTDSTDRCGLLVAAHHGATDGLGLLAVLATALGANLVSQASGIADRPCSSAFLTSAARRLAEALVTPPARIAPSRCRSLSTPGTAHGDILVYAELPASCPDPAAGAASAFGTVNAAALIAATSRAALEWNTRHHTPYRRAVAGLGVSRRDGKRATPVADSTFLRLRLPRSADAGAVRGLIATQPPEPNFPRSRSALATAVTRLLASRLGSTFLASNLGVVDGPAEVRSLAFYPTASGRSGIAVGAATIGQVTTVTLRARRTSFDHASAAALLSMIVAHLGAPSSTTIGPFMGL